LDPFLGSGTTVAASLELDRNSIGIEIKKEYYDLSIDNVKKFINK
jgi:DNA modification methylase